MSAFSPRLEVALEIATTAHQHQRRKVRGTPFIIHPVHIAFMLLKHGFAEDVVIAGLLHDVVEDTETGITLIRDQLGERVAELVLSMTDAPYGERDALTWEAQRALLLDHLASGDPEIVAIKVADSLHNLATLKMELEANGVAVWERFSRGAAPTLQFHRKILEVAQDVLGPHPIVEDLRDTLQQVSQLSNVGA